MTIHFDCLTIKETKWLGWLAPISEKLRGDERPEHEKCMERSIDKQKHRIGDLLTVIEYVSME